MENINIYSIYQVKEGTVAYDADRYDITSPAAAAKVIDKAFRLSERTTENFGILCLNNRGEAVGLHLLHTGALNKCIVDPRDVFKAALLNNAHSIIAFHNHPSSSLSVSNEDISLTERLSRGGELLGVLVKDHLIVGTEGFTSMKQEGLLL